MSGFKLSSKLIPCPICENTTAKCRHKDGDETYWQCMIHSGSKFGDIINGYKFLKPTKDNQWGQFKLDDTQEWTDEQRRTWQDAKQKQDQQRQEDEVARRKNSLSPDERNFWYRKLLDQLDLSPEHREDLYQRGFSDEWIEEFGAKSVRPGQRLTEYIDPRVSGVAPNGFGLLVGADGYLQPVRDIDGRITGAQIRKSLKPEDGGGRFVWLSSDLQILHLYIDGAKKGELPLPYFPGSGEVPGIAITEGTGAKPFITSKRLGMHTIGAAGVLWLSSKKQLLANLDKIRETTGSNKIHLYPDAGAIANPQVISQWERLIDFLISVGREVLIGWWGQFEKSHRDIDELPVEELAHIKYLEPAQFFKIYKEEPQEPESMWKRPAGDISNASQQNSLSAEEHIVALIEELPEGCAPEGEMPLAVYRHHPTNKPTKRVLFVEGAGLKATTAGGANTLVIGCPGGLWAESFTVLKEIVDYEIKNNKFLGAESPLFEIAPDAGVFDDAVCMNRIEDLYDQLEKWALAPRIKFWNQTEVGDPNIDELAMVTKNRILAGKRIKTRFEKSELYKIEELREAVRISRWRRKKDEEIAAAQLKLRTLSYPTNLDTSASGKYLPNDLITKLPKSGIIAIQAPKGSGKSWQISRLITDRMKSGAPILSITPRIALGREQAFKWGIRWIDDGGIKRYQFSENHDDEILKIAIEIEKQQGILEKLNQELEPNLFDHGKFAIEAKIKDCKKLIAEARKSIDNLNNEAIRAMGLCWDSLWRTNSWDLSLGTIIIDECELGITHLLTSSTTKRRRPELLEIFRQKINECLMGGGTVLLADADLTDIPIDYIRALCDRDIEPFVVRHQYQGEETKWDVTVLRGRTRNTLSGMMFADIDRGKAIAMTCDSQAEAEAVERLALIQCPEFVLLIDPETGDINPEADKQDGRPIFVRLDGHTSQSKAGKAILEKPNEFLKRYNIKFLDYTPTMGVGVSIDETTTRINDAGEEKPYFDSVDAFGFGMLEPSQMRQQMGRVRANVPRRLWVADYNNYFSGCRECLPEDVRVWTKSNAEEGVGAATIIARAMENEDELEYDEFMRRLANLVQPTKWDPAHNCIRNPHMDAYTKIIARRNYGLLNLGDLLVDELKAEGHNVISTISGGKEWVEALGEIKDERLQEKASEMEEMPQMLNVDEAKKVQNQSTSTREERVAAEKTILAHDIPGVELSKDFLYKAIFKDRRKWLRGHKLFWLMQHPEEAKLADSKSLSWNYSQYAKYAVSCWDDRSDFIRIKTILDTGIFGWIKYDEPQKRYDHTDAAAKEFLKNAIKIKDRLKRLFNISVTAKSYPRKVAQSLMEKIGLGFTDFNEHKGDTSFVIDEELLNDGDRQAVLVAMDRRLEESLAASAGEDIKIKCVMSAPQNDTTLKDIFLAEETPRNPKTNSNQTHTQYGLNHGENYLLNITNGSSSPQTDSAAQLSHAVGVQIDDLGRSSWPTREIVDLLAGCQSLDDFSAITMSLKHNETAEAIYLAELPEDAAQQDIWFKLILSQANHKGVDAFGDCEGAKPDVAPHNSLNQSDINLKDIFSSEETLKNPKNNSTQTHTQYGLNHGENYLLNITNGSSSPQTDSAAQLPHDLGNPRVAISESPPPICEGMPIHIRPGLGRADWAAGLSGVVRRVTALGRCLIEFANGRSEYFDDGDLIPVN